MGGRGSRLHVGDDPPAFGVIEVTPCSFFEAVEGLIGGGSEAADPQHGAFRYVGPLTFR